MSSTICLVTQNPGKLKAAESVFNKRGIVLRPADRDFPEIQAQTSLEIARYAAQIAAHEMGMPAIREDHSLYIGNLGLPGPYTSYWEKQLTATQLLELLTKLDLHSGYFEVATVYADPIGNVIENTFQVPMTFGTEVRGENPRGWDGLIRLKDETRVITEYPETERLSIWN